MRAEALIFLLLGPGLVSPPAATSQEADEGVRFSAFDVSIGGVFPERASTGLTYGTGVEVANLPLRGVTARLGFRFWAAADEVTEVDLDDGVLEVLFKAHVGRGRLRGYAGAGFGAHFVSARRSQVQEVLDERDGFHPGLQLLAGAELGLGRDQFFAAYLETMGSVVSEVSHVAIHVGVRVRFDRLGGPR